MFQTKNFSGVKMSGGFKNSKPLREKLIGSLENELKIVNERFNEKGNDWYVLKKVVKKLKRKDGSVYDSYVDENRMWKVDKINNQLLCSIKYRGINFKYGDSELKNKENIFYKIDIDKEKFELWINEMIDKLVSMNNDDEMFKNEIKFNPTIVKNYSKKK